MITNSESKIIYQGNGVAKEFVIGFPFTDKKDLKISIYNETTDKTKDLTYDYFVDIEKKVVIYPGYQVGQEPPENQQPQILQENEKLIIRREIPLTQEVDFGDKHPLEIIEKGFDKLTMIIQSLQEELSRAVKVEISSSTPPEELLDVIKQSRDIAVQAAKDAKRVAEETVKKVEEQLNEKVEIAQSAAENAANKAVENVEKQLNDEVIAAQFSAQTATEKAEIAILTANDITKKMEVAQDTVEKAKLQANRAESEADRAEKMANAFDMTNYYQKAKTDELLSKKQDYYSGNIKVEGDENKFYPVAFNCSAGTDGKPSRIRIRRHMNDDKAGKGFLDFEMVGTGGGWGGAVKNIRTSYYGGDFVADAKPAEKSHLMHVWLKGQTSYHWGGTHSIVQPLQIGDSITIQNDTLTSKTEIVLPKGLAELGVSYSPSAFAPSGFGLGGEVTLVKSGSADSIINTGFYNVTPAVTNLPKTRCYYYLLVMRHKSVNISADTTKVTKQIAYSLQPANDGTNIYERTQYEGVWTSWKQIATTESPTLNNLTVTGTVTIPGGSISIV